MNKASINRHDKPSTKLGRRVRALTLVVSLTASLIAIQAAPAAAAGGGCWQSPTNSGWQIAVCSSTNGVRATGDVYINSLGSGGTCEIEYRLWETHNSVTVGMWSGYQNCFWGRHPEIHMDPKAPGQKYYTNAILYINGSPLFSWRSPDVW